MGFDNVAVAIAKLNEIEATSAAYNQNLHLSIRLYLKIY